MKEIDLVIPEGFQAEFFPLKYNHTKSDFKNYSVEIDLYYFKWLKIKNHVFYILFAHPLSRRKIDGQNNELISLTV